MLIAGGEREKDITPQTGSEGGKEKVIFFKEKRKRKTFPEGGKGKFVSLIKEKNEEDTKKKKRGKEKKDVLLGPSWGPPPENQKGKKKKGKKQDNSNWGEKKGGTWGQSRKKRKIQPCRGEKRRKRKKGPTSGPPSWRGSRHASVVCGKSSTPFLLAILLGEGRKEGSVQNRCLKKENPEEKSLPLEKRGLVTTLCKPRGRRREKRSLDARGGRGGGGDSMVVFSTSRAGATLKPC